MNRVNQRWKPSPAATMLAGILTCVRPAEAAPILSEGFDNVSSLTGDGWVFTNNSSPLGSTGWFQGNSGVFPSQAGVANSYVAANFNNAAGEGNFHNPIDNWLISPELTLGGVTQLSFYTRTEIEGFDDGLEVRFSSGSSDNVSSFTTLLLPVGPGTPTPYPSSGWELFSVALPNVATGRIAFRYIAFADTANYIGIDTVNVAAVPLPASLGLFGIGAAGLAFVRRRRDAV